MPRPRNDYRVVDTEAAFEACLEELRGASVIAFDLETEGFDYISDQIVGWALSIREAQAWYIPVRHTFGTQLDPDYVIAGLKPIFEDESKTLTAHNIAFDERFLRMVGILVKPSCTRDSMLAVFTAGLGHERLGLKEIVQRDFLHKMTKFEDLFPPRSPKLIATVPIELAAEYACEDADFQLRVHNRYIPLVEEQRVFQIESRLWPVVQRIEDNGVLVDGDLIELTASRIEREARVVRSIVYDQIESACGRRMEINLASFTQLSEVLFNVLQVPALVKTPTGAPSTSDIALEKLSDRFPVCRNILTYRSMLSTARAMRKIRDENISPHDGRVHTSYNQCGARTGRFASSAPNVQNQGRLKEWKIVRADGSTYTFSILPRRPFVAAPGYYFVEMDFKAIEFVLMAALSGEDSVIQAYNARQDLHVQTATLLYGRPADQITESERDLAKTLNYLVIYGGGPYGLSMRSGMNEEEAGEYIQRFFQIRPRFDAFMQRSAQMARQTRKVRSILGRIIPIPEYTSSNRSEISKGDRLAVNGQVQSSAADWQKLGLLRTDAKMAEAYPPNVPPDWWFEQFAEAESAIADRYPLWNQAIDRSRERPQVRVVLQTHDSQTLEVRRDIAPDAIIPVGQEAMSPPVPGYPRIQVDAKVGLSWGGMNKWKPGLDWNATFEEMSAEDAANRATLQKTYTPPDALEQPQDQEIVHAPEEPAQPMRLLFDPGREIADSDASVMVDVLRALPGDNLFVVVWDGEEYPIQRYPTSLTDKTAPQALSAVFPYGTCKVDRALLVQTVMAGVHVRTGTQTPITAKS